MNGVAVCGETISETDWTSMNASSAATTSQRAGTSTAPASASGTSAASTGTSTFSPVPSLVLVIRVASIATASATSTFNSGASRISARRRHAEGGQHDEPEQAPERLAPDALEDVQAAPARGHLRDHAVVPHPEPEEQREADGLHGERDRRADRSPSSARRRTARSRSARSAYGHLMNGATSRPARRPRRRSAAARRAAPRPAARPARAAPASARRARAPPTASAASARAPRRSRASSRSAARPRPPPARPRRAARSPPPAAGSLIESWIASAAAPKKNCHGGCATTMWP